MRKVKLIEIKNANRTLNVVMRSEGKKTIDLLLVFAGAAAVFLRLLCQQECHVIHEPTTTSVTMCSSVHIHFCVYCALNRNQNRNKIQFFFSFLSLALRDALASNPIHF